MGGVVYCAHPTHPLLLASLKKFRKSSSQCFNLRGYLSEKTHSVELQKLGGVSLPCLFCGLVSASQTSILRRIEISSNQAENLDIATRGERKPRALASNITSAKMRRTLGTSPRKEELKNSEGNEVSIGTIEKLSRRFFSIT